MLYLFWKDPAGISEKITGYWREMERRKIASGAGVGENKITWTRFADEGLLGRRHKRLSACLSLFSPGGGKREGVLCVDVGLFTPERTISEAEITEHAL